MEKDVTHGKEKDLPKKLIVDANIIFSALVKDSTTKKN